MKTYLKKKIGLVGRRYMGQNSRFSWSNPKEQDNKGFRVAAVSVNTSMIQHIFPNVIAAANSLTNINQMYYAKQIGKALNQYHMQVLGYWWKRIN